MVTASAPGKLILFGEHFVVYGLPAIATAIDARTTAKIERADKFQLVDNRPETPGYKKEKAAQQVDSIQRMFKAMSLDRSKVKITLAGDLIAASGVGASAASCSAIAAALNAEFGCGLDLEGINEIAYEGEKGYHGTPSGIDNSCSTYGGFIWFEKNVSTGKSLIKPMDSGGSLTVIVGNTGKTSNTTKIIEDVKKRMETEPKIFEKIFNTYRAIISDANLALKENELRKVGQLMNKNHDLLKQIGVSSDDLEELVNISRKEGALGAKLTGTGRGGLMIALVSEIDKENVASAIEKAGYKSQITHIGAEGVKLI